MANESDFIEQLLATKLAPLALQAGGKAKLLGLPMNVFIRAAAHHDDILFIGLSRWVLDLPELDLTLGYSVYDEHHTLLYAETTLASAEWGRTAADVALVYGLAPGTFVYLSYPVRSTVDRQRILMLIKQ